MSSEIPDMSAEHPEPRSTRPVQGPRRWMIWPVVALAVGAFLWVNRPVPAAFTWEHDFDAGLARAKADNAPVLLEFQTRGCPACEWMDREVFSRKEVAQALNGWVAVRVDGNAEPKLSARYGVEAFPTFLVLAPDGKVLKFSMGAMPAEAFIRFLTSS